MSELMTFLLAQLDEDEQMALAAKGDGSGTWVQVDPEREPGLIEAEGDPVVYHEGSPTAEEAAHIARHDPARVLAEVEAKRAMIRKWESAIKLRDNYKPRTRSYEYWGNRAYGVWSAIEQMANAYSGNPGYAEAVAAQRLADLSDKP